MLSDYIFTPKDFWNLGGDIVKKFKATDLLGLIVLFLVFELFYWFVGVGLEALIFIFFIVILFYWRVDSRVSISLALASLIAVVVLLVMEKFNVLALGEEAANQVAVWAFYFLAIGVIKQIWEYRRDGTGDSTEDRVSRDEEGSNEYRGMWDARASNEEIVPSTEQGELNNFVTERKRRIIKRAPRPRIRKLDL